MNERFYKIADFLLCNLPSLRKWKRGVFLEWLQWHAMRLQVIFIEENGKILSVIVGRPVRHLGRAKMAYEVDEDGTLFHVEQMACIDKRASNGLLTSLKVRFPNIKEICFTRTKRKADLRAYDFERFMKIASHGRMNLERLA